MCQHNHFINQLNSKLIIIYKIIKDIILNLFFLQAFYNEEIIKDKTIAENKNYILAH